MVTIVVTHRRKEHVVHGLPKPQPREEPPAPVEEVTEQVVEADAPPELATVQRWAEAEDPEQRSYLFGCNVAYEAYDEDPRFLTDDRIISGVRTLVNNTTQSPRSGIDKNLALRGYDDTIAVMKQRIEPIE